MRLTGLLFLFFIAVPLHSYTQSKIVYEVNDFLPPWVFDPKMYNKDSVFKIRFTSVINGAEGKYTSEIGGLHSKGYNYNIWNSIGFFSKKHQFKINVEHEVNRVTEKFINFDTTQHANLFSVTTQIGYYPFFHGGTGFFENSRIQLGLAARYRVADTSKTFHLAPHVRYNGVLYWNIANLKIFSVLNPYLELETGFNKFSYRVETVSKVISPSKKAFF